MQPYVPQRWQRGSTSVMVSILYKYKSRASASQFTFLRGEARWTVDAGAAHGRLPACRDRAHRIPVRVRTVGAGHPRGFRRVDRRRPRGDRCSHSDGFPLDRLLDRTQPWLKLLGILVPAS